MHLARWPHKQAFVCLSVRELTHALESGLNPQLKGWNGKRATTTIHLIRRTVRKLFVAAAALAIRSMKLPR